MRRRAFLMICLAALAGCAQTLVDEPVESLGEFNMRVNYVFAEKAIKGPVSRDATSAEWTDALENAVDLRLARYAGTQEYDIGISLEGYMLAPPGVPIVLNPRSTAIILLNVYDVEQEKFLAKAHQIQVFEDTSGSSAVLGSGYSRNKEEQIAGLALNAADKVEEWLAEQHQAEGWFNPREPDASELEAPEADTLEAVTQ